MSLVALVYFVVGKFGGILPYQDAVHYYLNAWYFAWLGAPLAILANVVVSFLTKRNTPVAIRKFLAEQVHNY